MTEACVRSMLNVNGLGRFLRWSSLFLFAVPLVLGAIASAQVVTITSDTTVGPTQTTVNGVPLISADITVMAPATLTMSGRHTIRRLNLDGGRLTHPAAAVHAYASDDIVRGLDLTVLTTVNITSTGSIDLDGRGDAPGRGLSPGFLAELGAGGHGGEGASAGFVPGSLTHGSPDSPGEFGSGGYAPLNLSQSCIDSPTTPGRGGGRVKLTIAGNLTHAGRISADGRAFGRCLNQAVGSGAGGSIWIICDGLSGNGRITADGASGRDDFNGREAAGGGGRIRVDATAVSATGVVRAAGGCDRVLLNICNSSAGAGTIWRTTQGGPATLRIESTVASSYSTPLVDLDVETLFVSRGVATLIGPAYIGELRMENGAKLKPVVLEPLKLQVRGNVTISDTSRITATGMGNPDGQGPNAGTGAILNSTSPSGGGGGGNAGRGGNGSSGGTGGVGAIGDVYLPDMPGSGGGRARASGTGTSFTPGGAGGGVIHLDIGGDLRLSGFIEANGTSGSSASQSLDGCAGCTTSNRGSGGGAGGSIYLRVAGTIEPLFSDPFARRITAFGATSDGFSCAASQRTGAGCGGGGGGGSIALYNCGGTLPSWVQAGGGAARSIATAGAPGTVVGGSGKITITNPPVPVLTYVNATAQLSVVAATSVGGSLTYQWFRGTQPLSDSTRILGATTSVLTIQNLTCLDSADYRVLISDSCGQYPSEFVAITVRSIADFNQDGGVDGTDIEAFFLTWESGTAAGDINQDGGVDGADIESFFIAWASGGDC